MKKTLLSVVCLVAMAAAGAGAYSAHQQSQIDPLLLENVEALSSSESGGSSPAWWDYFNNYVVEERIPVTTTVSGSASIIIKGVTISISNSVQYSYAIYHHCYDGGNKSECTSSGVHSYI